ncbi:hypothetical protein AJ80_04494 [Polytolypa hystricis UAMH7299]|uniref:AB hydrolase-1 domain-containing protein n=1 Tax=Polytolypa hystricis (strain UAMH7299) TaxID=1447883 RepID=A0A2B7Y9W4_POLH7|nr:hypothetical protein AJ80_04494 [Polytolypa hystricis UAMH7299]
MSEDRTLKRLLQHHHHHHHHQGLNACLLHTYIPRFLSLDGLFWILRLFHHERESVSPSLFHSAKLYPGRFSALPLLQVARPRPTVEVAVLSPSSCSTTTTATSTTPARPLNANPRFQSTSYSAIVNQSSQVASTATSNTEFHPIMAQLSSSSEDGRGRQQQTPLASQRTESPSKRRIFPLGYKEGFNQWWASIPAAAAEHKVLSFLPYLKHAPTHTQTGKRPHTPNEPADDLVSADHTQAAQVSATSVNDPYGPRRWRSSMVELSGKDRALNEFSVERVGEKVNNNLVVLHGYGAGLGFFYKNYDALSRAKGWQLYALDLLGMGRSTRPPFKINAKNRQDAIKEAEDWFIDALEEWRVKRKLDRFTLAAHSMGGYMAVAYALKYPGRLNKLILVSPVGIPEDPYAVSAELPAEPSESTLANEFTQDQNDIVQPPTGDNNNFLNARSKTTAANNNGNGNGNDTPRRKPLPKWLTYLWDSNVSPFSLVRWSGPLGPRLVSGWTSRRFAHLPQPEAQALHDYAYSLFRMRGSGEYALAYILAPGAFARSPLIRRIHGVGRQMIQPPTPQSTLDLSSSTSLETPPPSIPSSNASASDLQPIREAGIPIVLMYGEHDWMDVAGGYAAQARILEEKERVLKDATEEEKRRDRGDAKVVVVKGAGHHLYLDGWQEFNDVMMGEMKAVEEEGL